VVTQYRRGVVERAEDMSAVAACKAGEERQPPLVEATRLQGGDERSRLFVATLAQRDHRAHALDIWLRLELRQQLLDGHKTPL
jgi:hypothetical protein